jgi:hypothetical protein
VIVKGVVEEGLGRVFFSASENIKLRRFHDAPLSLDRIKLYFARMGPAIALSSLTP